jgi:hypothetical protein
MNQALAYEIDAVMPAATDPELTLFEAATVTITDRTNTVSATGQPNLTTFNPIAGLITLPCMISIQRVTMPNQGATMRKPQEIDTETMYHLLLNGYYPRILQQNQAQVTIEATGIVTNYEIMAVESDSQATQTRLAMRIYTQ